MKTVAYVTSGDYPFLCSRGNPDGTVTLYYPGDAVPPLPVASSEPAPVFEDAALVPTIAALQTAPGVAGGHVYVTGYWSPWDRGGGFFYWHASSVAAPDGGAVIAATGVDVGRWIRVMPPTQDIRFWGAKGDVAWQTLTGTDDTTAIKAALAWAKANRGSIEASAGYYLHSDTLDLTGCYRFSGVNRLYVKFFMTDRSKPQFILGGIGAYVGGFAAAYTEDCTDYVNASVFEVRQYRRSTLERVTVGECYCPLAIYQGAVGTDPNNWFFSNGVRDFEAVGFRGYGMDLRSFGVASTGNEFANIYLSGGYGKIEGFIRLAIATENSWSQINFEHAECDFLIESDALTYNQVWNSVHVEDITPSGATKHLFGLSSAGNWKIDGLHLQYIHMLESKLGAGARFYVFESSGATVSVGAASWFYNDADGAIVASIHNATADTATGWCELGYLTSAGALALSLDGDVLGAARASTQKKYVVRNAEKWADRPLESVFEGTTSDYTFAPNSIATSILYRSAGTGNVTITLSTTTVYDGCAVLVTCGAGFGTTYTITIGGLKTITGGQWATFKYHGGWYLAASGAL